MDVTNFFLYLSSTFHYIHPKISFTPFSSIRIIMNSFYSFLVREIVDLNLKFAFRSEPYNVILNRRI